jgi:hypothetical protein
LKIALLRTQNQWPFGISLYSTGTPYQFMAGTTSRRFSTDAQLAVWLNVIERFCFGNSFTVTDPLSVHRATCGPGTVTKPEGGLPQQK